MAVTCFSMGTVPDGATVPIGRPNANVRAYVVDASGALAGVGEPGELWIGGAQVARGYHARPEETALRFGPDPFRPGVGERVYRTGDRARWREDGNLEFLGRLDEQVKLRGFRIEPGEIEACLALHPAVRQAAVRKVDGPAGDPLLAAYVTGDIAADSDFAAALTAFLSQRLPAHMVPSEFVAVDALPLTVTGKVDRAALPRPSFTHTACGDGALTGLERAVADAVARSLGRDSVGRDDEFLALGGQSLAAVRVVAALSLATGRRLPVRTLFERHTVADLARLLAAAPRSAAERAPATDALSPYERSLWLECRLAPESPAYNTAVAFRLRGELDRARLEHAVRSLASRHAALRTSFPLSADGPVRRVADTPAMGVEWTDLTDSGASLPAELARAARRVFDILSGPLARVTLFTLGPRDHSLLLTAHHLIVDDWSIETLLRDLAAGYVTPSAGAVVVGVPPHVPPVTDSDRTYWRTRLDGRAHGEAPDLGHARRAAGTPAWSGRVAEVPFEPGFADDLAAAARSTGVTPFALALTALGLLLERHGVAAPAVIGTPVTVRGHTGAGDEVGYHLNLIPARVDLPPSGTVGEAVRGVAAAFVEDLQHSHVPLAELLETVEPGRAAHGRAPLRVVLVLHDDPSRALSLPDLDVTPVPVHAATAKFDLTLFLTRAGSALHGSLEYRTALFDDELAANFARRYGEFLARIVAQVDAPLDQLALADSAPAGLDAARRTDYPRDATVDALFERAALEAPSAVALVAGATSVTYAELRERSERLARGLVAAGVAQRSLVTVCLPRSIDFVAAILAVMRAGAVYQPLDPSLPAERRALLLADAGGVVLTSAAHAELFAGTGSSTLRIEDLDGDPRAHLPTDRAADDAAYVMYTSGSTGRPKGVLVPHRAVVRLVCGNDFCAFGPEHTWIALAPVAFDASTLELWAPLLHGGTLVLLEERVPSFDDLGAALARHGVTSAWLTSSYFNALIDHDARLLAPLRQLLIGGEALSPPHVARALSALPHLTLVNGYGPTENTTFTCCHTITPGDIEGGGPIPIGRPIANTTVRVLDSELRRVPVGVPGELYAGGDGLALGYHRLPGLTAERFIDDPFEPGARLYRTGDRVRRRPDGALDFLGRLDDQVKVRGHRVEPGEVEAALTADPRVRAAAVSARADGGGSNRLVAHVVVEGDTSAETVRDIARARLPAALVPDVVMLLDTLPLTQSGKLDRSGLPDPHLGIGPEAGRHRGTARDELERRLRAIWSALLGVPAERLSVDDDFFAAGGHSLLALSAVARAGEIAGAPLSLRDFFDAPTIAAQAAAVRAAWRDDAAPTTGPVDVAERGALLPLSHGQAGIWLEYRFDPDSPAYNTPVALRLNGTIDAERLATALAAVVARHEALRTTFPQHRDGPRQRVLDEMDVPLDRAQAASDQEAQDLLRAHAARIFDLTRGPLIRALLVRRDPALHLFQLTFHHIVVDDWSIDVLLRDLAAVYEDRPDRLPQRPIDFADFAVWEQRWLQGPRRAASLTYWRHQLSGAPFALELPFEQHPPHGSLATGAELDFELPPGLAVRVRRAGDAAGVTPFVTTLAALFVLLARSTGSGDLVVGTPIARRSRPELRGLVGYFLNMVALRVRFDDAERTVRAFLRDLRATFLDALEHEHLPLEQVLAAVSPERDSQGRSPLRVVFVMREESADALELPGLRVTPVAVSTDTAKFDLTLFLTRSGDTLRGRIEYRTALFERERVADLARDYVETLERIAADPEAPLGGVLPGDARRRARPAALPTGSCANPPPASARVQPRDDLERRLLDLWTELLERAPGELGVHDEFFAVGGHSLLAVKLIGRIERRLGHTLPVRAIFRSQTVARLADEIRGGRRDELPLGIVALRAAGDEPPLFCAPGLGGHVFMYQELAALLDAGQPVYGLQFQDLDQVPGALDSVERLAAEFVARLRSVRPRGPYRLAGYSFGGFVALEMAQQLLAAGETVEFLGLFDAFAPGTVRSTPLPRRVVLHVREMLRHGPGGFLDYLLPRLRKRLPPRLAALLSPRGANAPGGGRALGVRVAEVRRRCLVAGNAYVPVPYPGRIWLYQATRMTDWVKSIDDDGLNGWSAFAPGRVERASIDCEHLDLFQRPWMEQLAERLDRDLRSL